MPSENEWRGLRTMRRRLQSRVVIHQAVGIMLARYDSTDAGAALWLLETASRQYSVAVHGLASALITAPSPGVDAPVWFPDRIRRTEPVLTFLGAAGAAPARWGDVVRALLDHVLLIARSDLGTLQLTDPRTGELWIAAQRGHGGAFLAFFDRVSDGGSACALAASRAEPVTVLDVATDPAYTDASRAAMLESGSRACQSLPITAPDGRLLGIVSPHYRLPRQCLGPALLHAVQETARQAGAWLDWYHFTIVLDALESVHAHARTLSGHDPT
ncbi:GAF domain-containing protein [Streptomyces sp. NPDC127063]|uniref:ANTAR domain-containing protein n=2 Tax=Streptomyces TaxID=1883 RepID=UPI00365BEA0E